MTGDISERLSRICGVYSEIKMAAAQQITRVSTGQVIWRGKHVAVVRAGGLPMDPLSAIGGVISADVNLRDKQLTRTTHDLARRLVAAIPNLSYSEKDSDLSQDTVARQAAHSTPIPGLAGRPSPHSFVSGIEQRPTAQLGPLIAAALGGDQWPEPADRLVLAQFWLNKEPQSSQGLFELASARFALGEATAALSFAQKAIQLNASLPECHFLQGRIYLQLDQPAIATQAMLKAASATGPKAIYFTALGVAYSQVGDYAMAAAALSRSLALEPSVAYAHLQIGVALVGIGDYSAVAKAPRQSMILSIADSNHKKAARALATFKAMDLQTQLSSEELEALEVKIS